LLSLLVMLCGTVFAEKVIYVDPVGASSWTADNPKISLYVFGDGDGWASSETLSDGVIKFTFDDKYTKMIIVRGPQANTFDNKWNQTADIEDLQLNKLYKANGYTGDDLAYTVEDYTEPVAPGYTVDFNTAIATSNHDFKVAKGWGHIVGENNYDGSGPYYMSYSYKSEDGVSGTGALSAARQYAGDNWGGEVCYDLLVTPAVNGTITLDIKASTGASASNNAFVEVYAINNDGTRGELLKTVKEEIPAYNTGSSSTIAWNTYTLAELTEEQKIGLRCQHVYIDNFTATSANIPAARTLEVTKVANLEGYDGIGGTTTYFEQQADGTLKVKLQVTLTNTGDYDFTAGDEGYSLTLASASYISGTKTYYDDATVAITEALAAGETKAIDVEFSVPFSTGWKYWFVKENISGTTSSSSRYAGVTAYEPKFIFRAAESTSTSSISGAQAYGLVSEATTKNFEIANTGTAPLIIKSITLPEGFTSANMPEIPSEGLSIAKGTVQALDITLPATTQGNFAGNLTIVYLDKNNAEQTYTLAFSGSVLPAGTWSADFNGGNAIAYPAGSIAEGGINSDYQYADGAYNYYIQGRTTSSYASENNKFITPKLHATAGQQLTFDVKGAYGSSYYAKVYVSTDRKTWGEPVAYYTYGEKDGAVAIGSSEWVNKAITFDAEGDYYVAFSLYGEFKIDNIIGLTKVDVAHDLYIKSVNWPDASVKSGTSLSKPSLDVIPLTDETAEAYTVKYVCGETVLAEGTPVALTASANSSKTFSFSWTPSVESTTVYNGTKVVFEFTDGTKFETEGFDLTVTNEPKFHFVKTLPSSKWYEPTDYTTPITFGKTNTADKQNFYVYNWGSAQLTVKSIAVPAGFTATPAEQFTVAAFDESDMSVAAQAVEITFSATEAGTYSGDMVITYLDGAGVDQTFTLAISGTKLDPTKWYANFGGESNQWPAGSVYQNNVSTTYVNTGDYAITSSSATDNIFITPKLTAAAGDKLLFNAKLYSSYWSEGKVVVYAAATREEVLNAEEGTTRVQLFSVSGQDETDPMTTDYQTFEVSVPAGDWYLGFEISGRPYVDEIYGLTPAAVAHDLKIASSNISAEAMQNVAQTATVNVLNFGLADEAADAYTVTVFVNGEAVATAETVALPMSHKLSDAGTQISASFRYPKVGTFPVYIEVKAGDYTVATEPVDVTFAEEVFVNDAIAVGTKSNNNKDNAIIDFYNLDGGAKTSDILYTADQLKAFGIEAGAKITKLAFIGTISSAKDIDNSLIAWYGLSTGEITYNSPDKEAMTEVTLFDGKISFTAGANEIAIIPAEPIVYDGTSDLRFYFEGTKGGWATVSFDYDENYQNMKWSNASSMKYNPLLYVTLAAEPATLSGTVKNSANVAIEGATITLVSADKDNVQYSGVTDVEGAYSINVIQANRTYDVTVSAEGYDDTIEENFKMDGASQEKNFILKKMNTYTATFTTDYEWAEVYAYVWSGEGENKILGEWPGTKLEAVEGVYTVTFKAEAAPEKIIFNNGNSGEGNQTADLAFENGKAYEYNQPEPMIADGTYYIKNVGTQKFLAAGANWGTHAVVNEKGLDFGVAIAAEGKYTLDSQVSNGGNNQFLNGSAADGPWTDGGAYEWIVAEVAEGVFTFSTGEKFIMAGEDGKVTFTDDATAEAAQWTLMAAATVDAANLASLEAATAENGVDATFFIKGADFNRNDLRNKAWTHTRNGGNETFAGPSENRTTYGCEYWNNTFDVYQTITDLPDGVYEFTIAGFATNGTSKLYANETEADFVNTGANGKDFRGVLDAIANGEFTGNTTGKVNVIGGTLKIGVKRTSNSNSDWTVFDNARLTYYGAIPTDAYKTVWEGALAAAQAALNNEVYAVVTGEERTALEQAIAANTTVEDNINAYKIATTALNEATATFTGAQAAYQSLADAKAYVGGLTFKYATAEKKGAAEATLTAEATNAADATAKADAVYVAFRQYAESSAMLEGVEGATDFTAFITNPAAEDNMNGWQLTGNANVKSNEPWTDGEGNSTHKYFDSDQWGDNSWDITLQQSIKLPKGKYQLTVKSRASADLSSFIIFAGEEKTEMVHTGASGNLFNRGWNDASVEFELTEAGTITIGVQGVTGNQYQWMSFSDFRLVRFEEYIPVYTVAGCFAKPGQTADDGSASFFGEKWAADAEANDLVKGEDGLYRLTFEHAALDEVGTIYYKVVEDHSWNFFNWGFAEGANADYVVNEPGIYNITFTFNPIVPLENGYNLTCEALYVADTAINGINAAVKAGNVYDMQGRKMEGNLKKGLYIINGKKVTIK